MRRRRASGVATTLRASLLVLLVALPRSSRAQEVPTDRAPADAPAPGVALPTPVLLVPGWGDEALHLASLRERFIEAGWPPGRVLALEFEDPVGSNRAHAAEVESAVRVLVASTGATEVDVVAHSMGGLATRRFLRSDPSGVRKVVFLATPHRGTMAAFVAWGEGADEMQPGSPFLDSLNTGGPAVPDRVEALALSTPVDLRIVPGESARLPPAENVRNGEVCCPTHSGMLDHDETFRRVVEFLRRDPSGGG